MKKNTSRYPHKKGKLKVLTVAFTLITFLGLQGIKSHAQNVKWYKTQLADWKASDDSELTETALKVEKLITEIQPSLVAQSGRMERFGEAVPLVIDCDMSSLSLLYADNVLYNKVHALILRLTKAEDFGKVLNMSLLNSFYQLKYVYFLVSFDTCNNGGIINTCLPAKVSGLLNNADKTNYIYLVNLQIPE